MLLVDTGVFVAAADLDDQDREACALLLETYPGRLVTTALVATEAGWLIRRQLDMSAEAALYKTIADGGINIVDLIGVDWTRMAELLGVYADVGLDAADASIIAIAERLNLTVIATLDERDFRIVRPSHAATFELLPSGG